MAKLYLQLNEPGSGEVSIPLDNPAAADIAILKLIELNYRGESRGGFFVENIDKTNVDSSEGMGRWIQASGRGLLAILEEAVIWDWFTEDIEHIRYFVALPKAAMLWTLLDEAHNRQVNIYGAVMDRKCFPILTWDFTMTHDSLGVAWTDSEDMEFKVGTSLLDVLRQIAALGIDFDIERNWVDGTLQLHAYANGLGNDISDDVHFRLGYNCTQVTDSEAGGEIRNAFMINFPDPVYPWVVLTDVPSINKYRRRETFLDVANASNAATATAYGQAELDALKNAKHAISLKISDANGPRCFVEYNVGDWISYDDGSGTEAKYRVRGIQCEWIDQWYADVVVELNDILMETLLRSARDLRKVASASSGSSLKMPLDPTATSISLIDTHDTDLTAHGGSPLSTAINDFIVGSAIGTWIKKTLAETRTILGIPSGGAGDVVGPAGATNNHVVFFDGGTGKLIKDSGLGLSGSNTGDQTLPVKASGAELDTGTDNAKFATAKALKDSHNVPSVVPSTAGKILTSNGTDWISSAPAGGGDVVGPAGATDGHLAVFDTATGKLIKDGGAVPAGGGDVVGPAGAVDGHLAIFDTVTGKLIKDGGAPGGGGAPTDAEYVTAADHASLSAEIIIPSLAGNPDRQPAAPNTEDDEFDSPSLDGKWTKSSTAANDDVDTTWPSCAYANFTGNQSYQLKQAYAPAGAFSITAKFNYATQANYQQASIAAFDDDESDIVMAGFGIVTAFLHTKDAGAWNYNRKTLALTSTSAFYVHLQRDGSNNWRCWVSFDGLSYWSVGTVYNKTLTVHHFAVSLEQSGATNPTRAGIDWVRRDWITL